MIDAKENLEILKDLSATGYESIRALNELNLRAWEKLANRQLDAFTLLLNTSAQLIKLTAETKDVTALINGEVELAKQFGETIAAKGREDLAVVTELRDEYSAWVESGVSTFTAKANEVAKKAA